MRRMVRGGRVFAQRRVAKQYCRMYMECVDTEMKVRIVVKILSDPSIPHEERAQRALVWNITPRVRDGPG